jgi:hypothetical protein
VSRLVEVVPLARLDPGPSARYSKSANFWIDKPPLGSTGRHCTLAIAGFRGTFACCMGSRPTQLTRRLAREHPLFPADYTMRSVGIHHADAEPDDKVGLGGAPQCGRDQAGADDRNIC